MTCPFKEKRKQGKKKTKAESAHSHFKSSEDAEFASVTSPLSESESVSRGRVGSVQRISTILKKEVKRISIRNLSRNFLVILPYTAIRLAPGH